MVEDMVDVATAVAVDVVAVVSYSNSLTFLLSLVPSNDGTNRVAGRQFFII